MKTGLYETLVDLGADARFALAARRPRLTKTYGPDAFHRWHFFQGTRSHPA
jgi:hypothetical protein